MRESDVNVYLKHKIKNAKRDILHALHKLTGTTY